MKLKFGYKVPSNLTFLSSCSSSEAIILFKLCFLFDILFLDNGGRISSVEYSLSLLLSNWLSLFILLLVHNLCFFVFDNIDEFEDVDNVLVIFFIGLTGGITPIGLRPSAIRFAQRSSSFLSFKLNCDESFESVINFSFIKTLFSPSIS